MLLELVMVAVAVPYLPVEEKIVTSARILELMFVYGQLTSSSNELLSFFTKSIEGISSMSFDRETGILETSA